MMVRAEIIVVGAPSARRESRLVAVPWRKPKPDASLMEDIRKYCKELSIGKRAVQYLPSPRRGREAGGASLAFG
jgi:hypothetical protein